MRVLVTGASGLVGRRLVAKLLQRNDSVNFLSRSPEKASEILGPRATGFEWDSLMEAPPAVAFDGVDAVIHLAGEGIGEKRWDETQKKRIFDSRILGTRHLFETIKNLDKKPASVISASAVGYYGNRGRDWLSENAAPGTGFLADVCRGWEEELFKHSNEGSRLVALRIGVVLAKEGGALKKLLPLYRWALGGPVGSGQQWMSWIHIEDLVGLFLHALDRPEINGPLNAVAPNAVSNGDFSEALGHAVHRPDFFKVPTFVIKMMLGEMSHLVLDSQRVSPERAIVSGYTFKFSFVEPALVDICKKKLVPPLSLSEARLP